MKKAIFSPGNSVERPLSAGRLPVSVYALVLAMLAMPASGCKKDNDAENMIRTDDLNTYIRSLSYDPKQLLHVQETGGQSVQKTILSEQTSTTLSGGVISTCTETKYDMKSNFEEVAILRPTNGVVYPGALVRGNGTMLDGAPEPIHLPRAPVKLRIDLPGMKENGNLTVHDPGNSTVQAAIDESLDWWNNNAYQDGYVSPSYQSYKTSTSYSAKQLSVDVGLNVEWADNNVAGEFEHVSTSTNKVAMLVYKQGFYSVTMDVPATPASIFASGVTVDDIQDFINNEVPPAYVHSVVYGRIIMFRMESQSNVSSTEIELALNYATGLTNVSGDMETRIKNILESSTTTVVTLGGNAKVASEAVSATNFGDLQTIIKGDNAVYNKSNPGVPIAYTIRYLKDNSLAKMGYTTEYTVNECTSSLAPAKTVAVKNNTGPGADLGWDIRFTITYKDQYNSSKTYNSGVLNKGTRKKTTIPEGAHAIYMEVEYLDGLAWKFLASKSWDSPTYGCFEAYGSWEVIGNKVPKFRSGNCGD